MKPYIDKYVGKYYTIFHIFVSLITILMLLFNNDIVFLAITLTIFTAELFINISYNDSPLTLMEEKIEKRCHKKNKKNKNNKNNNKCGAIRSASEGCKRSEKGLNSVTSVKEFDDKHNCINYYISPQTELSVNIWILLALKILGIICFHMFKQNFQLSILNFNFKYIFNYFG